PGTEAGPGAPATHARGESLMASVASLASFYPTTPPGIPADLTASTPRYRLQVVVVLVSLFLFLLFYLALIAGSAYLAYWASTFEVRRMDRGTLFLKVVLAVTGALLFLFLLKGLFKRQRVDESMQVEVTEAEQPTLFAFIRKLCQETGAPFPRRVFLSPEV